MYHNTVAMLVASVIVIPTLLWIYRVVENCGQVERVVGTARRSGLVDKVDVGVQAMLVRRWSCPARLGGPLVGRAPEVEYPVADEPGPGACEPSAEPPGQWWTFV